MSFNANVLVQLAGAEINDEYSSNLNSMPVELKQALQEQREAERKALYAEAAKLIMGIFKRTEEKIAQEVQEIREARQREAKAKARIADIERAKQYAEETNNYLPLALLCGTMVIRSNTVNSEKFSVPMEWKPKSESVKKQAAKKQV